jgi:nitrogen regulatory protein PII 2
MKEIMAVIRPTKVNDTKNALADAGFPSFTCQVVLGRGKKLMNETIVSAILDEGDVPQNTLGESLSEPTRLIYKGMFTLIVEDQDVSKVTELLIKTNQTKTPGDGKLFVLPISSSYRVRNGQPAADAY